MTNMNFIKTINSDIFYFLSYVSRRPSMWWIKRNYYSLDGFLTGFIIWVSNAGDKLLNVNKEKLTILDRYVEWRLKLQLEIPNNQLILLDELYLLASNNDPEKAFDLFFELFDEYKKEKWIIYEWDEA